MAENAALPIIEVRDNFNKVLINNKWCQFANFEYKITRHGEDIKTKGKWIILDCKTIKDEDGGEFTLSLTVQILTLMRISSKHMKGKNQNQ